MSCSRTVTDLLGAIRRVTRSSSRVALAPLALAGLLGACDDTPSSDAVSTTVGALGPIKTPPCIGKCLPNGVSIDTTAGGVVLTYSKVNGEGGASLDAGVELAIYGDVTTTATIDAVIVSGLVSRVTVAKSNFHIEVDLDWFQSMQARATATADGLGFQLGRLGASVDDQKLDFRLSGWGDVGFTGQETVFASRFSQKAGPAGGSPMGHEYLIATAAGDARLVPNGSAGGALGMTFVDPTGETTLSAEAAHLYLSLVGPDGDLWKLGNIEGSAHLVGGFQGGCQNLDLSGTCPEGATEPDLRFDVELGDQPVRRAIIGGRTTGIITLPEGVDM